MFSDYEKILVDVDSDKEIISILNNVNDNVIILYNQDNSLISKRLFRKGIENINFICDNNLSIIRIGKPDLVITNRSLKSDYNIICQKNNITIYSINTKEAICGKCRKVSNYLGLNKLNKICSEKCALSEHPGFYELLNKCKTGSDESITKLEKSFSNSKSGNQGFKNTELTDYEKKKLDKQQKNALMEAKRHNYQQKKVEYIRSMRLHSNTKVSVFDDDSEEEKEKVKEEVVYKMCKAKTKKEGKSCGNKALCGSEYCGIVSHRKMDPNPENHNKKKLSSNKKFEKILRGYKNSKKC